MKYWLTTVLLILSFSCSSSSENNTDTTSNGDEGSQTDTDSGQTTDEGQATDEGTQNFDLGVLPDVSSINMDLDSDNDGLPDDLEAIVGTDANNPDSDGDGINDGDEFGFGSNPLETDSDQDGLSDSEEQAANTNPQRADTDGDGFTDSEEASLSTDPLDRFNWDFGGPKWPNLSVHSDGVFGTGFELGDIVVNFEALDQNDQPIELFDFYSYVILFDFSAGWCNPCREAAAVAQELWEKHRDKGFMIIHILTEANTPGEPAFLALQQQWANQYGLEFPVLRQEDSSTYSRFTVADVYPGSLPFIMLLDREMRIDSVFGAGQDAAIEARVEELLETTVDEVTPAQAQPIQALLCDQDNDGADCFSCGGADCNDANPNVYPGAPELCDATDRNCDGQMHADAEDATEAWLDADEDTFGTANTSAMNCVDRWPYVSNSDDCDDADPDINPNTLWFEDADSDGYGNPDVSVESCTKPAGYVSNSQDSDDNNSDSLGCWTKVGVGRDHACALKSNGTLKCWGGNVKATVDPGKVCCQSPQKKEVLPSAQCPAENVLPDASCEVCGNGSCGDNENESNCAKDCYDALSVPDGNYIDFSAGYKFSCAIDDVGAPVCWGRQDFDCLNPPPGTFNSISCGVEFCCGLTGTTGDNVTCWGRNDYGQSTPPPGTFTSVSAHGWWHACGLKEGGEVLCWGRADGYQGSPSPTAVPPGTYKQVSSGHYMTCAVDDTDHAQCWGADAHNQSSPPTDQVYSEVSAGTVHSCGLRLSGEIDCWGSSSLNRTDSPPGVFVQLEASQLHSCAVTGDGLIECWGIDQGQGQLTPPSCAE